MCMERNMKTKGGMYQNVQKVSRKRVIGCQRRFECLRVVGRVVGTKTVSASDIRRNFITSWCIFSLSFSQKSVSILETVKHYLIVTMSNRISVKHHISVKVSNQTPSFGTREGKITNKVTKKSEEIIFRKRTLNVRIYTRKHVVRRTQWYKWNRQCKAETQHRRKEETINGRFDGES